MKKDNKFLGYTQLIDMSNQLFTQSLQYPEFENPAFTQDYEVLLSTDPKKLRQYLAYVNMRLGFCEQIMFFKNQVGYIDKKTFEGVFVPLIDAMMRFHTPLISELLEFYHQDLQNYLVQRYKIKIIRNENDKKILIRAQPLPGEQV